MKKAVLVFNSGSSSVKFSVYGLNEDSLDVIIKGQIEGIVGDTKLIGKDPFGKIIEEEDLSDYDNFPSLFSHLLEWIENHDNGAKIVAAGHRVVHGGKEFSAPVLIDDDIINRLEALTPLAPLHQPYNVEPIKTLQKLYPDMPQVACFDTAFHRTQDKLAEMYPLPRDLIDAGIIRYGFHGLSYEYISKILPHIAPDKARGRTIVAHLGNGASMCAMIDCTSKATTMGFTALEGLMMGTRCGAIDPGIILYLMEEKGMSIHEVSNILYKKSGLKGVSGIGNDMRDLLESDDPNAKEAIELFAYRVSRELGSLAEAISGLDTLVFTAGIGESCSEIREMVCKRAAWMGIELDEEANNSDAACITKPNSKVKVMVVPTNEELMIATHIAELVDIEDYHLASDIVASQLKKNDNIMTAKH